MLETNNLSLIPIDEMLDEIASRCEIFMSGYYLPGGKVKGGKYMLRHRKCREHEDAALVMCNQLLTRALDNLEER